MAKTNKQILEDYALTYINADMLKDPLDLERAKAEVLNRMEPPTDNSEAIVEELGDLLAQYIDHEDSKTYLYNEIERFRMEKIVELTTNRR